MARASVRLILPILAVLVLSGYSQGLAATNSGPAPEKATVPFAAPEENSIPKGPDGDLIREGRLLVTDTYRQLPKYVTRSRLRCSNCHLKAGTVPYAAPWVGVVWRYPRYSARSARMTSIEDRINGCFQRSLNGKPLPKDSKPMQAIVAYMTWLSQAVPYGSNVEGVGMPPLPQRLTPDRERGKILFHERCAVCHGKDGQGQLEAKPPRYPYGFPPVWGPHAFNIAAGMARLHKAAAFIKRKMPLASGGSLTDQEAYDVADFVIHQPRPDFPGKKNDWPKGGKPDDARY